MCAQRMKWAAFYSLTLLLLHSPATLAAEIRVPADQSTIQAGIDAAVNGDTVLVADGVYEGPGNRDLDFQGRAITVRSGNGAETCIIDCDGTVSDQHRGFYFHNGEGRDSVVEGFTIKTAWLTISHTCGQMAVGAASIVTWRRPLSKIASSRTAAPGALVWLFSAITTPMR